MNKYYKNEDFFKAWSSDMAYVLGWIVSDGHVGFGFWNIGIHKKDVDILNNIKEIIEFNGVLYDKKYDNVVCQHVLHISSTKMVDDLHKFGLDNNKSLTLKWIKNIPQEYLSHFIRGFFDGDGSIYYQRAHNPKFRIMGMNFVATPHFIEGLQNAINTALELKAKGNITHIPLKNKEGYYTQLQYSGVENVKKILDWIYIDSTYTTRLERKYTQYYDYFYGGEYEEYRKHADEFQSNKVYIPYALADEIRQDYNNGLNQNEISDKHQVNRSMLKDIIENNTHTRTDNRTANATRDFVINGEIKHEKDIAKENNMDIATLRHRTRQIGMDIGEAASKPVDRGKNNPRTHIFTIGEETKTLREWSRDARYNIPYPTLYHRVINIGMNIKDALTTTEKVVSTKPKTISSRAKLTQEQANEIRRIKQEKNLTDTALANQYGVTSYVINDIIKGKTYKDESYSYATKNAQLKFEYNGASYTLRELYEVVASKKVPYATIDRRLREGKTVEEAISTERMIGTKSISDRDIASKEMAAKVRSAYMCGKREKEVCEMFSIPKSRYIDIILNRTNKEEKIWWKTD